MKNSKQTVTTLSRSNIISLYPEWSSTTTYETESEVSNPTYLSTVRVGNYLYRSMSEDNLNNEPLSNPDLWFKWEVSNIYAMLDFKKATETVWDDDGIVEFEKGDSDTLVLGNIKAGAVTVDVVAPKNGVIDGLVLTESDENYLLSKGSWYAQNAYTKQNVNWTFDNTILTASKDNYIYPEYTKTSGGLNGVSAIRIDGNIAYVISSESNSITSLDISDSLNVRELDKLFSENIKNVADIAISNSKAYIAGSTGTKGTITIIDISDSTSLDEIGNFTFSSLQYATGIAIDGTEAYVAGSTFTNGDVVSLDISNSPTLIELHAISYVGSTARGIAIDGTEAYVTAGNLIASINIATPTALAKLDSYTSANLNGATGIAIDGTEAYVVSIAANSITSINITTPTALAELDSYTSSSLTWATGIAIDGTEAYVTSQVSDSITSINITTPTALAELDSLSNSSTNGAIGIDILGTEAFIVSSHSDNITSINIATPTALAEISHFPETTAKVISVPTGFDQPTTPDGDLAIWMVTTDASNLFVSQTDLRTTITDDVLDGYTQTKTFYDGYRGAWLVDLPNIGEIVRVSFFEANNTGTSCGALLSGALQEMGKTLNEVNITQIRDGSTLKRGASFGTTMNKNLVTITANQADDDTGSDMAYITEPDDDVHQHIIIMGQHTISHNESNADQNIINWTVEGEKVINGSPLGLTSFPFFQLGVDPLSIIKGSGSAYHERDTAATYIDKDYLTLKTADIDEVVYENEGMRGSCESTNILTYSEDLTNAKWTEDNASAALDATLSSDGITQCYKITSTVDNGRIENENISITSNSVYSFSLDIKKDVGDKPSMVCVFVGGTPQTLTIDYTFSTDALDYTITGGLGNLISLSRELLIDGWVRIKASFEDISTNTTARMYIRPETGGFSSVFSNFAQVKESAFPTSYTPTTTAPVTTSGDIISYDTASNIPDLTGDWSMKWTGTPYFEAGDSVLQQILRNYTNSTNFISLYIENDLLKFDMRLDGVNERVTSISDITSGQEIEAKIECISGIVKMYIDDEETDSGDYSDILTVPLTDITYIASKNDGVPNTNSVIYTKAHSWEAL